MRKINYDFQLKARLKVMSASRSVLVKLAKGSVLAIPDPLALTGNRVINYPIGFGSGAPAMTAFYERHEDSIRFGYRCFDRILQTG